MLSTQVYTHEVLLKDKRRLKLTTEEFIKCEKAFREGDSYDPIKIHDIRWKLQFYGQVRAMEEFFAIDVEHENAKKIAEYQEQEAKEKSHEMHINRIAWTKEQLKKMKPEEILEFENQVREKWPTAIKKGWMKEWAITMIRDSLIRQHYNCPYV